DGKRLRECLEFHIVLLTVRVCPVEACADDDSSTEYNIFSAPLSNGKGNRILCFAVFDENKTPS
ncbi:MAG TPA: hypothetical protein PLR57_07320, partial [Clostridia bacterium]|nr:hypothetical protein [Clostridia bacterium]